MRRLLSILTLLLTPSLWATTFTVNAGQSQATIQSTMNTADSTTGNTVAFTGGNYTGWTGITVPCSNGTIYTGPIGTAGAAPGSNNQWARVTSGTPAVLNSDNNVSGSGSIFTLSGGNSGHTTPGSGCTIQYLTFANDGALVAGGDWASNNPSYGILFQNNSVISLTNNGNGGTAIFLHNVSNSSVTNNFFGASAYVGTGGVSMCQNTVNVSVTNNIFSTIGQPIGSSFDYTSGCSGGVVSGNVMNDVRRIGIEMTNGNSPSNVTGLNILANLYINPNTPDSFSGFISMACCYTGAGTAGYSYHVNDNTEIMNPAGTPSNTFYSEELTGGSASQALRNLAQGKFAVSGPIVAVGDIQSPIDISNTTIEGTAGSGFYGCEYGGTFPNACSNAAGTGIVANITANSMSTSATVTQHTTTTPSISPSSGAFGAPPSVTFSNTQTNVSYFYTTNGSTPTTASTLYTGAFTCSSLPCTVKVLSQWGTGATTAFAYPAGYGWAPSAVATTTYTSTVTPDINCPVGTGFNASNSGPCSVALGGFVDHSQVFNLRTVSGALSGTAVNLIPSGTTHVAAALIYQSPLNIQAFTSNFTFIGNGNNITFTLQNNSNAGGSCPGSGCQSFPGGAGGEAGCSQAANGPTWAPTKTVCLELDFFDPLTNGGSFTFSSAQLYQPFQVPFLPINNTAGYIAQYPTTKLSSSPVSMTQTGAAGTCKQTVGGVCDTFSATVTYDGSTVTLTLFDVTAGGSCPGASCYTQTWTNVSIPSIVGSNTAYVTITGGSGTTTAIPLLLNSLVYTINTPTGTPSFTAYNANSTYNIGTQSAASPVYSLAPGTYTGTQSVTITTSRTPNNYICYVLSATTPAFYPQPDNNGGCASGTLYSSPVSISSTATLYAMAGSNNTAFGLAVASPAGLGPPSTLVRGAYTINAGTVTLTTTQPPYGWLVMPGSARTPVFYPGGSGATTKLLNYSVTGGATLSCTSNCLPEVTVTMPSSGGTCSVSGSVGSYVLTSTVRPVLTATSVDDPTKSVTVPWNVCNTTTSAFVDVEPSYNQAYQGQKKTLQSYVIGYIDQRVTWAITTAPGGGNATLSDTSNRDVIFSSGTVSGRYVIAATSVANGAIAGTAIIYVSPNSLPAYSVTPNKTEPTECFVDPALTGTDYEVGSGQPFPDLTTVPFQTWPAGSIVRIHPGTYTNSAVVQGTGTATQPLIICGIADGSGNLPVIDGNHATENAATGGALNGAGGLKLVGTTSGFGAGYELGSVGPDYISITGLEITRFNVPYSYFPPGSSTLTPYGGGGNGSTGISISTGQHIHIEGVDLEDDDWGVLANSNTTGVGSNASGRRFTQFHQFIGGHINNFSQPGSFSNHGLYMEAIRTLVEGTLFEHPQYDISNPISPSYDNGDFIKMRGGESIIRYNFFHGLLTGAAIAYPDMEDTVSFVDIATQLGQPTVSNCSLSTWCSITSNNITLNHLAENMEALAKDYFYGNAVSNEAGRTGLAYIGYGSFSAVQECANIGVWCTPGIDRSGQIYAWSNTFDQPGFQTNSPSAQDSAAGGVFLTANPFNSGFVGAAQYIQPTIFAANNIWWSDPSTCSGSPCFPFTVNVDATAIITLQTNMAASSALPCTGTITGGTTTGWGGYSNAFSYPLFNPMQNHLTGLGGANCLTTPSIPYNRATFAPVGGSALISAGSKVTLAELSGMPVRSQPLNTGGTAARTDSASSTPTIGAVQTGSLPTLSTAVISPSPSTLVIPSANIGSQQNFFCTATFSDSTSSFCTYRSQPWASSNNTPLSAFGGSFPLANIFANGSGVISTGFAGAAPSVNFVVGGGPITVATPTFSPVAGSYGTGQNVAITTVTGGATICYTVDGSTPTATTPGTCSHGTTYTSPVLVSTSLTINAIGTMASAINSSLSAAAYTITTAPSGANGNVIINGTVF